MRQIIYRGKAFGTREWVYGNLRHRDDGGNFIETTDGNHCFPVLEDTVGQYTGLKDKNGKMIFEGDLLDAVVFDCFDNDKRYKLEVKWLGTGFYAVNTDNEDNAWELDWLLYQDEEAEVIGNINDDNFKS